MVLTLAVAFVASALVQGSINIYLSRYCGWLHEMYLHEQERTDNAHKYILGLETRETLRANEERRKRTHN